MFVLHFLAPWCILRHLWHVCVCTLPLLNAATGGILGNCLVSVLQFAPLEMQLQGESGELGRAAGICTELREAAGSFGDPWKSLGARRLRVDQKKTRGHVMYRRLIFGECTTFWLAFPYGVSLEANGNKQGSFRAGQYDYTTPLSPVPEN